MYFENQRPNILRIFFHGRRQLALMMTLHKEAPRSKPFCLGKFCEGVNTPITNGDSGAVRAVDIWELVPITEFGKSLTDAGALRVAHKSLIDHSSGVLPFCTAQIIHWLGYQAIENDFLEPEYNGLSFEFMLNSWREMGNTLLS